MTEAAHKPFDDELGAIDYLVVEFAGQPTPSGFNTILDLVDRGMIAILDVEFVKRNVDGSVVRVAATDLTPVDGLDLSLWEGAASKLLDDEDLAEIGAAIKPESVAVVVIFENLWLVRLAGDWSRRGARIVSVGSLVADDLLAALDATESN